MERLSWFGGFDGERLARHSTGRETAAESFLRCQPGYSEIAAVGLVERCGINLFFRSLDKDNTTAWLGDLKDTSSCYMALGTYLDRLTKRFQK
jgi:hypothetical protein